MHGIRACGVGEELSFHSKYDRKSLEGLRKMKHHLTFGFCFKSLYNGENGLCVQEGVGKELFMAQ